MSRVEPPVRRRRWPWVLMLVLLGLGVLAALAWPMRAVPDQAEAARAALVRAADELRAGDLDAARADVAAARTEVDDAQSAMGGVGGTIWGLVPVVGGGVQDAQALIDALDHAVEVADTGVAAYPQVAGKDSTLLRGQRVDLEALGRLTEQVTRMRADLRAAEASLRDVEGSTPVIGASIRERRDAALDVLTPLTATFDRATPVLQQLPAMLGQSAPRHYLVVFTNPSELRYSGGAALTFADLTARDGRLNFGAARPIGEAGEVTEIWWPKVRGNPFHRRGKSSVQNSTFNPDWSVSGEELLRAFKKGTGERPDGVLVVDVQALARLLAATGPVPGTPYGDLDAANLVATLVGSYDTYTDPEARRDLNAQLAPIFRDRLFGGGDLVGRVQAVVAAARDRELAVYDRDPATQEALARIGLTGDLSSAEHDYVGVFSQNTNVSKVDYFQRRAISSRVRLAADGSARVRLRVDLHNDTPPYAGPEPDPREQSYQTRWAGMSLAAFLPDGADLTSLSVGGKRVADPRLGNDRGRAFVRRNLTLAPGARTQVELAYTVPHAAVASGDTLTYRLAVDPQALVQAPSLQVTVEVPQGFRPEVAPAGWRVTERGWELNAEAWRARDSWALRAVSGG